LGIILTNPFYKTKFWCHQQLKLHTLTALRTSTFSLRSIQAKSILFTLVGKWAPICTQVHHSFSTTLPDWQVHLQTRNLRLTYTSSASIISSALLTSPLKTEYCELLTFRMKAGLTQQMTSTETESIPV